MSIPSNIYVQLSIIERAVHSPSESISKIFPGKSIPSNIHVQLSIIERAVHSPSESISKIFPVP